MPKHVRLRTLTTEEAEQIRRLAASRKESVRLVQRARLIALMLDDPALSASKAALAVGFKQASSGMDWVRASTKKGCPAWPTRRAQEDHVPMMKACADG